jgi:hypothetical protein
LNGAGRIFPSTETIQENNNTIISQLELFILGSPAERHVRDLVFYYMVRPPESMEGNAYLRHTPRAIFYPFHLTTTLADTPLGWVVPCSKTLGLLHGVQQGTLI